MVGGIIHFATGASISSRITGFTSATSLSISPTQTVGASSNYVIYYGATQTAGGNITSQTGALQATSNQLILGTTNTTTINSVAPSASRVYTIPDAGTAASFVMTEGTQTINGTKTFSTAPTFSTALAATGGGTGQTTYAVGDILYASTTSALSRLADIATGNALISGGVNTAPSWGIIGLTTHVSGTLGIGNGGTGTTSTPSNGQLLIGNGTNYSLATITPGTGISVSNGAGTVTISATSGGVNSVTGTANQVTVSPTTGATVVSLPTSILLPGSITFTDSLGVAAAGTTIGTATTVSSTSNVVSVGSATVGSAQGISLSQQQPGFTYWITNATNVPVNVYPPNVAGSSFTGLATQAPYTMPAQSSMMFVSIAHLQEHGIS